MFFFSGTPGRPKLFISEEQLEFFIQKHIFYTRDIAIMMGVSLRIIERRMAGSGLRSTYTDITDEQLDGVILEILRDFHNTGYRRMTGILASRDLVGTMLRALEVRTIRRRRYWQWRIQRESE